ncbi:hypothetical protein AB0C10_21460 [Microbispora amethystogenes]|uniref:Acb2/Tad1 domain-containing protein n=1 Tax=Microbispora amethystogenes TaxID=1427754 RepID=UPI0033D8D022
MTADDIANRFDFHPADTIQRAAAHQSIRAECRDLAEWLNENLPESREKAQAITHLEEVMFWANAAVARQS